MDLQSQLSGKSLAEFGEVIGEKLPATDEFEIQGRLSGSTDALALQKAQVSARRGSMRLSLSGAVKDLLTLRAWTCSTAKAARNWPKSGRCSGQSCPGWVPLI